LEVAAALNAAAGPTHLATMPSMDTAASAYVFSRGQGQVTLEIATSPDGHAI